MIPIVIGNGNSFKLEQFNLLQKSQPPANEVQLQSFFSQLNVDKTYSFFDGNVILSKIKLIWKCFNGNSFDHKATFKKEDFLEFFITYISPDLEIMVSFNSVYLKEKQTDSPLCIKLPHRFIQKAFKNPFSNVFQVQLISFDTIYSYLTANDSQSFHELGSLSFDPDIIYHIFYINATFMVLVFFNGFVRTVPVDCSVITDELRLESDLICADFQIDMLLLHSSDCLQFVKFDSMSGKIKLSFRLTDCFNTCLILRNYAFTETSYDLRPDSISAVTLFKENSLLGFQSGFIRVFPPYYILIIALNSFRRDSSVNVIEIQPSSLGCCVTDLIVKNDVLYASYIDGSLSLINTTTWTVLKTIQVNCIGFKLAVASESVKSSAKKFQSDLANGKSEKASDVSNRLVNSISRTFLRNSSSSGNLKGSKSSFELHYESSEAFRELLSILVDGIYVIDYNCFSVVSHRLNNRYSEVYSQIFGFYDDFFVEWRLNHDFGDVVAGVLWIPDYPFEINHGLYVYLVGTSKFVGWELFSSGRKSLMFEEVINPDIRKLSVQWSSRAPKSAKAYLFYKNEDRFNMMSTLIDVNDSFTESTSLEYNMEDTSKVIMYVELEHLLTGNYSYSKDLFLSLIYLCIPWSGFPLENKLIEILRRKFEVILDKRFSFAVRVGEDSSGLCWLNDSAKNSLSKFCVSRQQSAHLLLILVVCLKQLMVIDKGNSEIYTKLLENEQFYSDFIIFLTTDLYEASEKTGLRLTPPALSVFSGYYYNSNSIIQVGARVLLSSYIRKVPIHELQEMVNRWVRCLPSVNNSESSDRAIKASILLGNLVSNSLSKSNGPTLEMTKNQIEIVGATTSGVAILGEKLLKEILFSFCTLLSTETENERAYTLKLLAADFLGQNWEVFETIGTSLSVQDSKKASTPLLLFVLKKLWETAGEKTQEDSKSIAPKTFCVSNKQLILGCRQALVQICQRNPYIYSNILCAELINCGLRDGDWERLKGLLRAGVLLIVKQKPISFFPNHISRIMEAIIKGCLDPNIPFGTRERLSPIVTSVIHDFIKIYPTVTFNASTQRLAIATGNNLADLSVITNHTVNDVGGQVIVWDLKTATRIQVIDAHSPYSVTAISFNKPSTDKKGSRKDYEVFLATYSMEEQVVKVWHPYSNIFSAISSTMNSQQNSTSGSNRKEGKDGFFNTLAAGASGSLKMFRSFQVHRGLPTIENFNDKRRLSYASALEILQEVSIEWQGERSLLLKRPEPLPSLTFNF